MRSSTDTGPHDRCERFYDHFRPFPDRYFRCFFGGFGIENIVGIGGE